MNGSSQFDETPKMGNAALQENHAKVLSGTALDCLPSWDNLTVYHALAESWERLRTLAHGDLRPRGEMNKVDLRRIKAATGLINDVIASWESLP